jgi:hypothetical protein
LVERVSLQKTTLLVAFCFHISAALDQKTGNFKEAFVGGFMQWSALPEEKQKNQLALTKFRFIK